MNILRYLSGTILGMMVLACLHICWSCSEDKAAVPPPGIELTTQGVEIKALVGDASVLVNVANAVEGVELKAECSTTWVTDLSVADNKVSFSVLPYTADEDRETTITQVLSVDDYEESKPIVFSIWVSDEQGKRTAKAVRLD